jgi:hypothetical protein
MKTNEIYEQITKQVIEGMKSMTIFNYFFCLVKSNSGTTVIDPSERLKEEINQAMFNKSCQVTIQRHCCFGIVNNI